MDLRSKQFDAKHGSILTLFVIVSHQAFIFVFNFTKMRSYGRSELLFHFHIIEPNVLSQSITQKLKAVGDNDEEKILLIKVIGNMGLPETLDELATIAEDASEPVYIRTQAIYAMRVLNLKHQPEEALETLLPLYRESKNPTQVRIAAFLTILTSKPDLAVLEDIAQSLNREVDLDVASYVYSSLSSVANSTDPCLANL